MENRPARTVDGSVDIRGDAHDPISRGYICPKAAALADLHHDSGPAQAAAGQAGRRVRRKPRGGFNDVTDEQFVDKLGETAAFSGQRVKVRAVQPTAI